MRLADFYQRIGPYLEGRVEHEAAVRSLYADAPGSVRDAERLAIYGRFARTHRFESVDQTYSATRAAVIALRGLDGWESLVTDYYQAHPMHHVELVENGDRFATFVAEQAAPRQLAAWVGELADLDWWEWRTQTAPDDPADQDPEAGPLRIASTVDLRPYQHDLVRWLDAEERGPAPAAGPSVVLFWRDAGLRYRREPASSVELAVLQLVLAGRSPLAPGALPGVDDGEVAETVADLRAARILLGSG